MDAPGAPARRASGLKIPMMLRLRLKLTLPVLEDLSGGFVRYAL